MIDIHTHILPCLDDGAEHIEAAIAMARAAASEGITDLIATPHHANGKYINPAIEVGRSVEALQNIVTAEGIPLTIHPGQEIRVHDDLLDAWGRGELLTLAGSSYMLIEMPGHGIPRQMDELIHELGVLGIRPIIAHPERNRGVRDDPDKLAELIDLGASAQVTTHSLLGEFGHEIKKTAWSLCSKKLIHLVSSDAHHVERRGFLLAAAYARIESELGPEWKKYYEHNAYCMLRDQDFPTSPIRQKSHKSLSNITKNMTKEITKFFRK